MASGPPADPPPDVRPLGYIAVATAALSVALALTYFLSFLAYLPAALALILGCIVRSDAHSRGTGTTAVALSVVAVLVATALLLVPAVTLQG